MKKLLALAFVCNALSAHASIGETKQQVEKRYGKPIKRETDKPDSGIGDTELVYQWKEYFVFVTYISGRSEREVICREDNKRILIPEIEDLLKLQRDGFKRGKVLDDPKNDLKIWETPNGDVATYQRDRVGAKRNDYWLFVITRKYAVLEATQKPPPKAK